MRSARIFIAGRFTLLAVFLLLFAPFILVPSASPSLFAQDYSSGASGQDSQQAFTLSGSVVNAATGAPVPRALVTLYGPRRRSVMSNAEGQFSFEGVTAGSMQVGAEKPGYFSEQEMKLRAGNQGAMPETVTVVRESSTVTVKLIPESVIAGRITENGVGVEGVPVTAMTLEIQDGFRQWAQRGNAVSDEDGEFRLAGLTVGEYYLQIGPKGPEGMGGKGPQSGYGRVFYPGPPAAEGGSPMAVGLGQRAEMEIGVKREPWFVVSGAVRATEPVMNWNIQLVDDHGGTLVAGGRHSFETGEFEMRAPAGNYTLRAMTFARGRASATAMPLTVHGDVTGLQVAVGSGGVIPVKIKTESAGTKAPTTSEWTKVTFGNGRKLSGAGMPPVSIYLRRMGEFEEGRNLFAAMDESGRPETLAVRGLEPGNYWLEASNNAPWYVASAECGGVDLLREELTVTTGAPCAEIDVTLRDDGASLHVSGTWDGDPAQAAVLILPERAPQQTILGQVSKDGDVGFGDLAPGAYNVLLIDRADGLEYKNPEAMAGHLGKAAHVTLGAGQEGSVKGELVRR
ncbi:MAG TPA: carboxypeptidase-like regulatory domain-containing protein [Candidatus Solibacter sp.]|nr:carboxypeptidase-like regulatory domain-containing protein [Candidatus Solibacter sp.]